MTNGEKLCIDFPNMRYVISEHRVITTIGVAASFDLEWWNAEYKEPTNTIDYLRAFKIACDLLNGDILYGVDADKIYELMMQKDDVVSSNSYEEYILNHLQELDRGQYVSSSEIPNKSIEEKCPCYHCEYFEIKGWSHCKIHEDAYGDSRCNDYHKVNQDLAEVKQCSNKSEIPTGSTTKNDLPHCQHTDSCTVTFEYPNAVMEIDFTFRAKKRVEDGET